MIKQFLALRYSLVEHNQKALVTQDLPDPKGRAITVSIGGDREFNANGVRYSFVGFEFINPIIDEFPSERFLAGKMAKYRQAHLGTKVPGDIQEFDVDNWIPIHVIVDIFGQYIFVQKDYKFGTEQQICNALQEGLRTPVLDTYNHLLFIEPKLEAGRFWSIIKEHSKIYKVDLTMISPNILETNKKARQALEELKKLFDQDDITIRLRNEKGDLKIPPNPISEYVDYIEEGEGKWAITTEGERGGKKTHKSIESAMTFEITTPTPEEHAEESNQLKIESINMQSDISHEAIMVAEVYSAISGIMRK
ncbi:MULTISPECIES: hypothetical protein [unclassified Pseudomonas]|uniref:hypothetical protein n=1 Tax=unclassified Pseudomonas TaxID=196821 RepID=UPI0035C1D874